MTQSRMVQVSIGCLLFMTAWSLGLAAPLTDWVAPASEMNRYLINKGILSLVFALALWRYGLFSAVGFRPAKSVSDSLKSYLVGLPLIALGVFAFFEPGRATITPLELAGWSIVVFLVAFTEETLFRGLLFEAFFRASLWRRAIVTSLLFGLMHSIPAGLGDFGWGIAIVYGLSAASFGLIFAAMRERAGTIWSVIVVHIVFDIVAISGAGNVENLLEPGLETYIRFLSAAVVFSAWGISAIYLMTRRENKELRYGAEYSASGLSSENTQ